MRGRRDPISRLRAAIECLPVAARRAMLDGIRAQPTVMVGAYTDGRGGACPMLAAHRNGSRVSFLGFARAWDAYSRARDPRPATEREVRTLVHLLEDSLREAEPTELGRAIADHQRSLARRAAGEPPAPDAAIVARRTGAGPVRRLRPWRDRRRAPA